MTVTDQTTAPRPGSAPNPPSDGSGGLLLGLFVFLLVLLTLPIIVIGAVAAWKSGGDAQPAAATTTVEVSLQEWSITGDLVVPAGEVELLVTNNGSMAHNLFVRETGAGTSDIGAGGVALLDLGALDPGTYELYCEIVGHAEAGMVADLVVTDDGAATGDEATAGMDHGGADTDWAALDMAMTESILAFPAETEGRGNPILEPVIAADGAKVFELTAAITEWEIEPGVVVEAWTYNDVVPSPQINVDVGDTVRVVVNNQLPMGTDVHWHGIHTPNDQDGVAPLTQDLIESGETYTYEFVAEHAGIGMYHPHHHGQMQVINGMFGVFQIGDDPIPRGATISGVPIPADLEVAADIPMVLNDAGEIGLTLNGKSFPATEPVVLDQGDWANITYYNEGLSAHPMHLHQFPQLIYAKDGVPLDHPYWADTVNIAPGERYSALFYAGDPGVWVWHCHILTHVEREEGMFGMVTAVIVNEVPGYVPPEIEPGRWMLDAESGADQLGA